MNQRIHLIENNISELEFFKSAYAWLTNDIDSPTDILENVVPEFNVEHHPFYVYNYDSEGDYILHYNYGNKRSSPVKYSIATVTYAGSQLDKELLSFVEQTSLHDKYIIDMKPINSRYDFVQSRFKSDAMTIWENETKNMALTQIHDKITNQLQGQPFKELKLDDIQFKITAVYALIYPFWRLDYSYKGSKYYVVVDGINPKRVIGTKPTEQKIKKATQRIYILTFCAILITICATLLLIYYRSLNTIIGLIISPCIILFSIKYANHKIRLMRREALNKLNTSRVTSLIKTRTLEDELIDPFKGL